MFGLPNSESLTKMGGGIKKKANPDYSGSASNDLICFLKVFNLFWIARMISNR